MCKQMLGIPEFFVIPRKRQARRESQSDANRHFGYPSRKNLGPVEERRLWYNEWVEGKRRLRRAGNGFVDIFQKILERKLWSKICFVLMKIGITSEYICFQVSLKRLGLNGIHFATTHIYSECEEVKLEAIFTFRERSLRQSFRRICLDWVDGRNCFRSFYRGYTVYPEFDPEWCLRNALCLSLLGRYFRFLLSLNFLFRMPSEEVILTVGNLLELQQGDVLKQHKARKYACWSYSIIYRKGGGSTRQSTIHYLE